MIDIKISQLDEFNPRIIIDARSPREYGHSHIVGAVNFYALNDMQYDEIGTIYKQKSKSHGKILGASYICKNVSKHLLEIENSLNLGSKIAIYCARGGMRSKSLGVILDNVGYRVARIENGYKSYRQDVLKTLEEEPTTNFITLFGNTGCGKSELIQKLNPSIDLESLANHLGSSFGGVLGSQPSTKSFQNALAHELKRVEKFNYCFIEGESKRIGNLMLPSPLYEKMQKGMAVCITSSMEYRVKRILHMYQNIDDRYFHECMQKISPYIKKSIKSEIIECYKKGDLQTVVYLLLKYYYDKVYKKPKKVHINIRYDGDIDKPLNQLRRLHEEVL